MLSQTTVLIGKLSCICHHHSFPIVPFLAETFDQLSNKMGISRNRIISHKYHHICLRISRSLIPGCTMVKLRLCHMMNLQIGNVAVFLLFPIGIICIHNYNSSDGIILLPQTFQQRTEGMVRFIYRDNHINCRIAYKVFHHFHYLLFLLPLTVIQTASPLLLPNARNGTYSYKGIDTDKTLHIKCTFSKILPNR